MLAAEASSVKAALREARAALRQQPPAPPLHAPATAAAADSDAEPAPAPPTLGATAVKSGPSTTTSSSSSRRKKLAFLELRLHVADLVLALDQHPLETWLGLPGPLRQAPARERHHPEQLLARCSSAQGRPGRG